MVYLHEIPVETEFTTQHITVLHKNVGLACFQTGILTAGKYCNHIHYQDGDMQCSSYI